MVAGHVRSLIDSGALKPGDQAPSGRALAAGLGVNLVTALKALRSLRAEGVLAPGTTPNSRFTVAGVTRTASPAEETNSSIPSRPGRTTLMNLTAAPSANGVITGIWAELTGKCQIACLHCYAGSGPDGTHGTMTSERWETTLADAAALGARTACFIGGCFRTRRVPRGACLIRLSSADARNL